MEDCGRGAAVEQLTARGMEYQSPRWGTIGQTDNINREEIISIPAMRGNRDEDPAAAFVWNINPRDGGNRVILTQQHHTEYINPRDGGGNSTN